MQFILQFQVAKMVASNSINIPMAPMRNYDRAQSYQTPEPTAQL